MAPLERLSALSYILPSAFLTCAKVNYVGTVTCYLLMHPVGPLGVGAGEPGPLLDDGTGMALVASVATWFQRRGVNWFPPLPAVFGHHTPHIFRLSKCDLHVVPNFS